MREGLRLYGRVCYSTGGFATVWEDGGFHREGLGTGQEGGETGRVEGLGTSREGLETGREGGGFTQVD